MAARSPRGVLAIKGIRLSRTALAGACLLLSACTLSPFPRLHPEPPAVRMSDVREAVLSWHIPQAVPALRGARLLADAPRPASPALALARSIVRCNPRLDSIDALRLAIQAQISARAAGLNANFFGATILQESAFDPFAVSSAGALGIAQFMPQTAEAFSINPLDPRAAMAGSARLLASYVARYRSYALALAAYNAGPLAVDEYHGVPPYAETRTYIDDIDDRIARITSDEQR
jgi:soluble lytic murein transglycosylase-like protein